MFLPGNQGPGEQLIRFAMGLSMKHLRIITGVFSGHFALKRHLTVLKFVQIYCALNTEKKRPNITF